MHNPLMEIPGVSAYYIMFRIKKAACLHSLCYNMNYSASARNSALFTFGELITILCGTTAAAERTISSMTESAGKTVGYLSGTFDLFHIGHLNIIRKAKALCDHLIVGVHETAAFKNGITFIPFEERLAIVRACRYVDEAVTAGDEDSSDWERFHFDKLFVGSDYKGSERFERYETFFAGKQVQIIYLPYTESTSSTKIRALINKELADS